MKNVKKLLIFASISTFVFASWTRTAAIGGSGFWADDYSNINTFPASVNDHQVAYTNGSDFTSIFDHNGTTWGFSGGSKDDVVNMYWGNGEYGATFGLGMSPETSDGAGDGETNFNGGFGMPLSGMDFGVTYASGGEIDVNLRRAQDVWIWDHMLINVGITQEGDNATTNPSKTEFAVDCYTNRAYEGGTSGLFALGFHYAAVGDADAKMNLAWNFAVESDMTDWATLRVGYSRMHDLGGGQNSDGVVSMGVGFNYGSFTLDMLLNTADLDDDGSSLFTDPIRYMAGRNAEPLGTMWTISYNW